MSDKVQLGLSGDTLTIPLSKEKYLNAYGPSSVEATEEIQYGHLLMTQLQMGDWSSSRWPAPTDPEEHRRWENNLVVALMDSIEMGFLDAHATVLLPDGTEFDWKTFFPVERPGESAEGWLY